MWGQSVQHLGRVNTKAWESFDICRSRVQRSGGLWKFGAVGGCLLLFSAPRTGPELWLTVAAASASHTAGWLRPLFLKPCLSYPETERSHWGLLLLPLGLISLHGFRWRSPGWAAGPEMRLGTHTPSALAFLAGFLPCSWPLQSFSLPHLA